MHCRDAVAPDLAVRYNLARNSPYGRIQPQDFLDQHPGIRQLRNILGTRLPRAEDVPKLPYTRMLIQEVLRLYPPVWAIPRQVVADCEIGGYRVAAVHRLLAGDDRI